MSTTDFDTTAFLEEYAEERDARLDQIAGVLREMGATFATAREAAAVADDDPSIPTDRDGLTARERAIYESGRRDALEAHLEDLELALMGNLPERADPGAFEIIDSGTPAEFVELLEGKS